jgi:hypothetical protein
MKRTHRLLHIMLAWATSAYNRNIWRSCNGKTIKVSFLHGSSGRVKALNTGVLFLIQWYIGPSLNATYIIK